MHFIRINKEKRETFWYCQIKGLYWFCYHNSPLLLYIVFRHMNAEGQGNSIAACILLIKKNVKSFAKCAVLENCIILLRKAMLNATIDTTSGGLYKHHWGQHQAFWRQQFLSFKFSDYLKTLSPLIWWNYYLWLSICVHHFASGKVGQNDV